MFSQLPQTPVFGDTWVLCLAQAGRQVWPFVWPRAAQNAARHGQYQKTATDPKDVERNFTAVVMIRLARVGARKQPYYRIVVIEKDRARNGRSIEVVGTYNPRTNPATVVLKHDRVAYWRGVGAQLTPIVAKLVAKAPVIEPETAPAGSPAPEAAADTAAA